MMLHTTTVFVYALAIGNRVCALQLSPLAVSAARSIQHSARPNSRRGGMTSAAHGISSPGSMKGSKTLPVFSDIMAAETALFKNHDNDIMNALFEPSTTEQTLPVPMLGDASAVFASHLPADFPAGVLCRIGPNPQPGHSCPSFLDGDGMVHVVTIPPRTTPTIDSSSLSDGGGGVPHLQWSSSFSTHTPHYSRSFVRARGFSLEADVGGKQLFAGTLVAPRGWPMLGALANNAWTSKGSIVTKDTANTALAWHGGRLLALMEQSKPTELKLRKSGKLETLEAGTDLGGAIPVEPVTGGALSAHGRVDPESGSRVVVSYSSAPPPFVRIDEFGISNLDGLDFGFELVSSMGVDTPTPVMVHDCALTPTHTVVLDLPMTVRPERMLLDKFPVEFEPKAGARLGFVPRRKKNKKQKRMQMQKHERGPSHTEREEGEEAAAAVAAAAAEEEEPPVVWVDVEPCVVLHTCNAHHTDHHSKTRRREGGGERGSSSTAEESSSSSPESSSSSSSQTWTRVVVTGLRCLPNGPQSFISDYTPAFLYEWVVDIPTSTTTTTMTDTMTDDDTISTSTTTANMATTAAMTVTADASSSAAGSTTAGAPPPPPDLSVAKGKLVSERYLSSLPCEFPVINPRFNGKEARFTYCVTPLSAGGPIGHGYDTPKQAILIDGLVKLDLRTGDTLGIWRAGLRRRTSVVAGGNDGERVGRARVSTGEVGTFVVSEPTFVSRRKTEKGTGLVKEKEDDGYVLLVVTDVARSKIVRDDDSSSSSSSSSTSPATAAGQKEVKRVPNGSSLLVFDARDVGKGPVASLPLPADVPYGLHSCYVPWEDLEE